MTAQPSPAEQLIEMVNNLSHLIEAAAGYRQRCEAAGFSHDAAEEMATELHSAMLRNVFTQAAKQ